MVFGWPKCPTFPTPVLDSGWHPIALGTSWPMEIPSEVSDSHTWPEAPCYTELLLLTGKSYVWVLVPAIVPRKMSFLFVSWSICQANSGLFCQKFCFGMKKKKRFSTATFCLSVSHGRVHCGLGQIGQMGKALRKSFAAGTCFSLLEIIEGHV